MTGPAPRIAAPSTIRFVPVGGTGHPGPEWVVRSDAPFLRMMALENFQPIRWADGRPLTWDAKIWGLWFQGHEGWNRLADDLEILLGPLPYWERNIIAHSHGGNGALILAARGFKLCTLTTISTPVRADIDIDRAEAFIGFHQQILDPRKDWIAVLPRPIRTLGRIGDWVLHWERRFLHSRVVNKGIPNHGHSGLLKEQNLNWWREYFILTDIRDHVTVSMSR